MTGAAAGPPGDPLHWQAVLSAYQASRRLPSIVAGVLRDGELVWSGTAGGTTTLDTQYRIGSITKTMTAVLVLQLREEGLLDLDDPVGRFVPETGYRDATLRELLSHTSGMQSEPVGPWWERSEGVGFDELTAANDGSGAVFGRGETYHYSNLGFALLGEVVARLRGAPWWDTLTSRLLAPLGMGRTSYLAAEPAARGFSVHHYAGTLTSEPSTDNRAMAPAGQLWSTVADLAVFLRFLAQGHPQVLSAETLREMAVPQRPAEAYALGMRTGPVAGLQLVGHLGSMPGFQAVAFVDQDHGSGLVALTNGTTGFSGVELAQRMFSGDTPPVVKPWVPSAAVPEWVEELLGQWFWGNSAFELRWHNERLEFHDVARGALAEQFRRTDSGDRIVGTAGYHHGETLHVVRRRDGSVGHLECATFVYTRIPYDPAAPIPGR
ncbi:CubicO group peptidase (beta-lactamase class C family) [Marmoricola sp. URHA0025 HA25]